MQLNVPKAAAATIAKLAPLAAIEEAQRSDDDRRTHLKNDQRNARNIFLLSSFVRAFVFKNILIYLKTKLYKKISLSMMSAK